MIFNIILLLIGFILLIKGADLFVEGSSSIAKILKVPTMIIGLTIVAMGTSAPEAAVSITASLKGQNAIAISNVIGSNIFNLLVVGGVCAMIKPLHVKLSLLKKEFPFSIISGVLVLFICSDFLFGKKTLAIGRLDGIILLVLFIMFLIWMVISALKSRDELEEEIPNLSAMKSIIFIVIGLAGVIFGGDLVVDSATYIALALGLSQTLIGLTIIALGTSLPELVTSVVAAKKGESDMALGNIIGSNIFNLLLILGLAGSICPIGVTLESIYDLLLLSIFNIITFLFCTKSRDITKKEGFFMVILYAVYMVYICIR